MTTARICCCSVLVSPMALPRLLRQLGLVSWILASGSSPSGSSNS